ncbi:MAG: ADP-ribosylglycohydrolase family protein, partial [Cyanobacteria bacterium J06632_3]
MLGAIAGDIIGSVYEFNRHKRKTFPLFTPQSSFTDDSILSVAVAQTLLSQTILGERLDPGELSQDSYAQNIKAYAQKYPNPMGGYGARFNQWATSDSLEPYNSWGNGSAMRVSPVGFAYQDLDTTLAEAKRSASVTHNHPEGIKGAQATAACIFLARQGANKLEIKS